MPRREHGGVGDRERVEHMLAASRDAIAIAARRRREELDTDAMLRHALIHCVELIGEAAARVTDAGRARVPGIPWPRIVGMRHVLIHAYFEVDLDAVWRVLADHIPPMVPLLEEALTKWPADEEDQDA